MKPNQLWHERLWDKEFCQTVDRLSSGEYHVPALELMQNAGQRVFEFINNKYKSSGLPRLCIFLVGTGNNGGDGLVAARLLMEIGCAPTILLVNHDKKELSASCREQMRLLRATNKNCITDYKSGAIRNLVKKNSPVLIVDAILGIGFKGPLKDPDIRKCLTEANALEEKLVIAIDTPSGVDVDQGGEQETLLPAAYTITFGNLKPAQVLSPMRQFFGDVIPQTIGFAAEAIAKAEANRPCWLSLVRPNLCLQLNPWQNLNQEAHKYDRGHILIVGGSAGKAGALQLSALAALRAGAGWVSVAADVSKEAMQHLPTEVTLESFYEGGKLNAAQLRRFIVNRRVQAIVVGPGCMQQPLNPEAVEILSEFSLTNNGFIVMDAGGVHGILDLLGKEKFCAKRMILTPHPGEWKKLSKDAARIPLAPLSKEGIEGVQRICQTNGITLVYKHATPVVISDVLPALVSNAGNNILSKAGTGDVLAGVTAAHGVMGLDAPLAFMRSYCLVAKAAEMAATDVGRDAVIATDIIQKLGLVNS